MSRNHFTDGAITLYGRSFQSRLVMITICNSFNSQLPVLLVLLPPYHNASQLSHGKGLGFSPFARHY